MAKNVEQKATGTQQFEPPNVTRLFPTTCGKGKWAWRRGYKNQFSAVHTLGVFNEESAKCHQNINPLERSALVVVGCCLATTFF